MTTVRDQIQYIATLYPKKPSNSLSERDFLVDLAKTFSFRGCDELGCGLKISQQNGEDLRKDADAFIDSQLPLGTLRRLEAEKAAKQLFSIAQKYRDSREEYDLNGSYAREVEKATAAFHRAGNL